MHSCITPVVMPESMALLLKMYSLERFAELDGAVMKMRTATITSTPITYIWVYIQCKKHVETSAASKHVHSSSGSNTRTR